MNLIAAEQIIRAYANANGVSYNEEVLLRKCKEYADHEDWNPYFVEFAYRLAGEALAGDLEPFAKWLQIVSY